MKVICNRGALCEILMVASRAVASRTTKPALQCVKLSASGGELLVGATDLEVSIRQRDTEVEVSEEGEMLVASDRLRDIARESADETLSIETSGGMAVVRGKDALFKIYTQPVEEFPAIPDFQGKADLELRASELKRMIEQTLFAAARESTRYALNAALISAKGQQVSLVATDGRRLAESRGQLSSALPEKQAFRAIVPLKVLGVLTHLLVDGSDSVEFQVRETQILARTTRGTVAGVLVEGQFPPYEDVVPRDCDKRMRASTAELLSAVSRAALLTSEESRGVRLRFSKKGLVLSSQAPGAGEATINFPCAYEGDELEIGFNPGYLIDALRVAGTDEVTMEMTTANRPGLLRAGPEFQYVLMPVNLQ